MSRKVALGGAALLALCLAWVGPGLLAHSLSVAYWVDLVRDPDHRMQPGDFPDLNSDGIRADREADSIGPDDFSVVFLGDSFVFGFLMPGASAPPAQLEAILREHYRSERIHVWNFGWTSSSPYLSLRLLRDLGPRYRPDLVVLNLDMTDFKDDFFYRHVLHGTGHYRHLDRYPRLFFHVKELTRRIPWAHALHQRWFGYPGTGDYFIARQPLQESRVYFDTVRDSLAQLHAYCRDVLGVPLVVFFPPRHWQYTDREAPESWERDGFDVLGPYALEPFRYFEQMASGLPYPFVPLLDDFRATDVFPLNFTKDSHWNRQGARFAAERVFHHCRELGCFRRLEAIPLDERR